MTPEEELSRAGSARAVLESPIFAEMRDSITSSIRSQMLSVPASDQIMHTRLITALQVWNGIEKWFQQIVDTGQLAEIQIAQEREKRRIFQFGRRA